MGAQNQTLTIASGQSASPLMSALELAPAVSIWIGAPAGLVETVKLRTRRPGGSTFYDQQTNNADIALTAGKALQVVVLSGIEWRLESTSGAVGGDRIFDVVVNRIGVAQGLP